MRLGTKVLLALCGVFGLLVGLFYGALHVVVSGSFAKLENAEALEDLDRCRFAIEREVQYLSNFTWDWSAWDDTYKFIQNGNAEYVASNLGSVTFEQGKLNVVHFYDADGRLVWGRTFDLETMEEISLDLLASIPPSLADSLIKHRAVDSEIAGLIRTPRGLLLVASCPIVTTAMKGPVRGAVVMGRFLDDAAMQTLRDQVRIDLTVTPIDPSKLKDSGAAPSADEDDPGPRITSRDARTLTIETEIADVASEPVAVLAARVDREVYAYGRGTLYLALIGVAVIGAVVMAVTWNLVGRLVVRPIRQFTDRVLMVSRTTDLTEEMAMDRRDEIGTLSREFEQMMKQLAAARAKVAEQSYRAGMAEMAIGTLHNLGNAINPLKVRLDALREALSHERTGNLDRALAEYVDLNTEPERRRKLGEYLKQATKEFLELQNEWSSQASELGTRMSYVEQILASQRRFGETRPIVERVRVHELLEQALALLPDDARQGVTFELTSDIRDLEPVSVDRIRLLQVIENVLQNAAESVQRTKGSTGRVRIEAAERKDHNATKLHLKIRDTGAGIDPSATERIFEFGESVTGASGRGIGLHWCANTIQSMSGRIFAESEGIGRGTVIHIELPAA